MKKPFIIVLIVVLVLAAAVALFYTVKRDQVTQIQTSTSNSQAEVKQISVQSPIMKRDKLENVISNESVAKWGFAVAGNSLFYVDPYYKIIRYDIKSAKSETVYESTNAIDSVGMLSGTDSALVTISAGGETKLFLLKQDSIRQLSVTATDTASRTLAGYLVPEQDQAILFSETGKVVRKFADREGRSFGLSNSENSACLTSGYDLEKQSGKVRCTFGSGNGFEVEVDGLSNIYNNEQTALFTYSKNNIGYAVLYDTKGREMLRLSNILPSSPLATNEGFYILSKPLNFESDTNKENGVAFAANSGEIKTIFDTNADGKYTFDSMAISGGYLYLREGPMVFRAKAMQ